MIVFQLPLISSQKELTLDQLGVLIVTVVCNILNMYSKIVSLLRGSRFYSTNGQNVLFPTTLWTRFFIGAILLTTRWLIESVFKLSFSFGGGIYGRLEIMLCITTLTSLVRMSSMPLSRLLIFGFIIGTGRINLRGISGVGIRLGSSWLICSPSEFVWGRIKNIMK